MNILSINFTHAATSDIQTLIRDFLEIPAELVMVDGEWTVPRKRVTNEFIAKNLDRTSEEAALVRAELVEQGFIDESGKPLAPAMALAGDKGLPRISRAQVEVVVRDLIDAARNINSRPDARIFVERVEVFGSYLHDQPDYGDVDVLVTLTPPIDFTQEEGEEEHLVYTTLQEVSPYVSISDQFDAVAGDADKVVIFDRSK